MDGYIHKKNGHLLLRKVPVCAAIDYRVFLAPSRINTMLLTASRKG